MRWQKLVPCLNLVGFHIWNIGIAVGAALAFGADVGVSGLWWGLAVGLTCTAGLGVYTLVTRTDWQQEVQLAQQRVGGVGEGEGDSDKKCNGSRP